MSDRNLIASIEKIYAALDDPGMLSTIGRDLAVELGSDAGDIVTEEKDGSDIVTWSSHGFDDAFLNSYDADFLGDNPWFDYIASRAADGAVSDRDAPRSYRGSAYVNEWIRPQGLGESLGAVLANDAARHSWIGFTRARGARRWSARDRSRLNAILPHLRRVMRVLETRHHAADSIGLAQAINDPIFVLDLSGRVLSVNSSGNGFLESPHGQTDPSGRLRFADRKASETLGHAIRRAPLRLKGSTAPEAAIVLRDQGTVVGLASVMPLPSRRETRVVVALRLLDRAPDLDLVALAHAFGLTGTEAALAAALASGQSVAEFAKARSVSPSTMRWHLKNLEAKTGTNRIDQLVAIVLRAGQPLLRRHPSHVGGDDDATSA